MYHILRFCVFTLFIYLVIALPHMPGCYLRSAPAPLPKRVDRFDDVFPIGEWEVNWGSTQCRMWLYPNHEYACSYIGYSYTGSWRVSDKCIITIIESINNTNKVYEFTVKMDFNRETQTAIGCVNSGSFKGTHVKMIRFIKVKE